MTSHETEAALYANAMEQAAESFRREHPDAFRRMNDGIMGDYRGELGGYRRRVQMVTRACAEAAGFPSLAVWLNRERAA